MSEIRKTIRLTESQAANWDPDKIREYLYNGCQTKTITVRQKVRQEIPTHVKRAWDELSYSIASVFRASKWSSKYEHYLNFLDWFEGIQK